MSPASGTQTGERGWTEGSPSESPQQAPSTGDTSMQPSGSMGEEQGTMDEQSMGQEPSGSMGTRDHAAMLTSTRCQREFRCDQIGSGKKYPSMEVCQATLLADANKELGKCPGGMNRKKVQECAAAIETKGCEMPGDSLTEFEECRTVSLCM